MGDAPTLQVAEPCPHCWDWGRTVEPHDAAGCILVKCNACGRLTWPHLGINLPAGAAAGLAAAQSSLVAMSTPIVTPESVRRTLANAARVRSNQWTHILAGLPPQPKKTTPSDQRAFEKRVAKRRAKKKRK